MRLLGVFLLISVLCPGQQTPAAESPADEQALERAGTVVLPAGTKIPLVLKHAISTRSAKPGDPVYLESNFPITQDDRMLVPAGTYVQGTIVKVTRPGRIKGRAELLMHFTTMIFPNGYTVALPGAVDSVPGAESTRVKDEEGTVQHEGQKGRDVGTVAGTGATGGVIGAASGGGKGALIGAAAGGATGLAIALLTRGDDVRFEPGTSIEMVLQRPLTLEEAKLNRSGRDMQPLPARDRKLAKPVLTPPPGTH